MNDSMDKCLNAQEGQLAESPEIDRIEQAVTRLKDELVITVHDGIMTIQYFGGAFQADDRPI